MQIPFIGGAYTSRSSNINAQTCINLFPVINNQEAKAVIALYGTPGLDSFSSLISGEDYVVRAIYVANNTLYAVVNAQVYSVTTAGVATLRGTISTTSGPVFMADNGTQVIIVDGTTSGYIITLATNSLDVIVDADFPDASCVTFQDGYFIVVAESTGRIYISGLYSGTTWDALDYATVEGRPDDVIAVVSNTHDLWLFGETSTEVFYNSGNADFPFERIQGALIDIGIAAIASHCKINGQIYWLSDKRQVCRNQGYQYQFISTPDIDYQISTYSIVSDAIGFTYTLDGHSFYVLTFPTAGKTWVYDLTNEYWHEWQSYKSTAVPWGRHRANCAVQFGLDWIVGDYTNGTLYSLNMSTYTDNGHAIRRQRATQVINKERLRLVFHRLEVEIEAGIGLSGGVQGEDPIAVLDWSDDGGHTWSNQHWRDIGQIGEYKNRAVWNRLGSSRNRVFRLSISDPVKVVVLGATADIEECKE